MRSMTCFSVHFIVGLFKLTANYQFLYPYSCFNHILFCYYGFVNKRHRLLHNIFDHITWIIVLKLGRKRIYN